MVEEVRRQFRETVGIMEAQLNRITIVALLFPPVRLCVDDFTRTVGGLGASGSWSLVGGG